MKLHELKPAEGSRKVRNRVGRGTSSGNGKTAGTWSKRSKKLVSGGKVRLGLKVDKVSIVPSLCQNVVSLNVNAKEYALVNLDQLNVFEDGTEVTPVVLKEAGIIRAEKSGVKVLGNGELTKKIDCQKQLKFLKNLLKQLSLQKGGSIEVI